MRRYEYPVLVIQPEQVLEPEALGSKTKFWYRPIKDQPPWLFKFPQANTGQHWAEKIAAEVAACLEILHARVELAVFGGTRGSATESFARNDRDLFHGNQILAGKVLKYDPDKAFRQSDHTLVNIFEAIDKSFPNPLHAHKTKVRFADYLVLDALIGNTDRHHEIWGILLRQVQSGWQGMLAPSFDHASSLGRELIDTGEGKCRKRLLSECRVGNYAEKAHGAIYWASSDARGLSPLELVRRGVKEYPDLFRLALLRVYRVDRMKFVAIIEQVPIDWMTQLARDFALELMCYNYEELCKVRL